MLYRIVTGLFLTGWCWADESLGRYCSCYHGYTCVRFYSFLFHLILGLFLFFHLFFFTSSPKIRMYDDRLINCWHLLTATLCLSEATTLVYGALRSLCKQDIVNTGECWQRLEQMMNYLGAHFKVAVAVLLLPNWWLPARPQSRRSPGRRGLYCPQSWPAEEKRSGHWTIG